MWKTVMLVFDLPKATFAELFYQLLELEKLYRIRTCISRKVLILIERVEVFLKHQEAKCANLIFQFTVLSRKLFSMGFPNYHY